MEEGERRADEGREGEKRYACAMCTNGSQRAILGVCPPVSPGLYTLFTAA